MHRIAWSAAAVLSLASWQVIAHSGGLNAEGCHHDRKHGGYHCHRGPSAESPAPARVAPQRSNLSKAGEVYYPNCAAARAAGAAPVQVGEPGYGRHLDRDGDGVGCE